MEETFILMSLKNLLINEDGGLWWCTVSDGRAKVLRSEMKCVLVPHRSKQWVSRIGGR